VHYHVLEWRPVLREEAYDYFVRKVLFGALKWSVHVVWDHRSPEEMLRLHSYLENSGLLSPALLERWKVLHDEFLSAHFCCSCRSI
jgi:hypothetical protein